MIPKEIILPYCLLSSVFYGEEVAVWLRISKGLVYHLTDDFYALVQDYGVKQKSNGHSFPAYCCRKSTDSPIIWMIPMSTNIDKYRALYKKEIEKYGRCLSVVIGTYDEREVAFHIQGMFPITKKYILHIHTRRGKRITVNRSIRDSINLCVEKSWELYMKGIGCFLSDIKLIENLLISEANEESKI